MDQRGGRIGLALAATLAAWVWVWSAAACRSWLQRPTAMPFLTLATLAAVYLCVPETDQLRGVALLVVGLLLIEWTSGEILPLAWHAVALVTVLWAGLWGAQTRHSAAVGAVFAGWVLVLPAVVQRFAKHTTFTQRTVLCALAAAAAVVMARTGGIAGTTSAALRWAAAVAGASVISAVPWLLVGRRQRPMPR